MSEPIGFYAKNDVGGLVCCDDARVMFEVVPSSVRVVSIESSSKSIDDVPWSYAYGWRGFSPASLSVTLNKIIVEVTVPMSARMPILFFTAEDSNSVFLQNADMVRTTYETSGGRSETWHEKFIDTPSLIVGVSDYSATPRSVAGKSVYRFTVLCAITANVANSNILFRAFSEVTRQGIDFSEEYGMEVYDADGDICFTSRPLPSFFLPKPMYIKGIRPTNLDSRLADTYSMAPIGTSIPDTDGKKWVSYYCGSTGAKTSPSTIYRSHKGGGEFLEVAFYDQYHFTSSGLFTSGVTPGGVGGTGTVYSAALPLSLGRALGKAHSEDWGGLSFAVGLLAAVAAVFTAGASLMVAVGVGTIAGTLIANMSFYNGIGQNATVADIYNGDVVVWLDD